MKTILMFGVFFAYWTLTILTIVASICAIYYNYHTKLAIFVGVFDILQCFFIYSINKAGRAGDELIKNQ